MMNDYMQKNRSLRFIKYLSLPILLLFMFTLVQPVFASTAHSIIISDTPTPPDDGGRVQTGAPVVRLLVTYTSNTDGTPLAYCTGLGVLVKSIPASASNTINDWVLTDGSLVNKTQATCAGGPNLGPIGTRSEIEIFFNKNYTDKTKQVKVDNTNGIMCNGLKSCATEPVLLAFHGDQASPMALAPSASNNRTFSIELTKDWFNAEMPPPSDNTGNQAYVQNIPNFLTPQVLTADNPKLESGTPFVDDSENKLTGLRLANGSLASIATISSMIGQIPTETQSATPTAPSGNPGTIILGTGISLALLTLGIMSLIVLVLLILYASLLYRSHVRRERARDAEIENLDRQAEAETRTLETKQAQATQQAWEERNQIAQLATAPIQPQGSQNKVLMRQAARDVQCPQCGEFVTSDANFCPRCKYLLSPAKPNQPLPVPLAPAPATLTPQAEFDAVDIKADINIKQLIGPEGE